MDVFKFNKNFLSIMGIIPSHRTKKPFEKPFKAFSFYFNLIYLGSIVVFSVTYVYDHFTDLAQLSDIMISFMTILGGIAVIGSFISIARNEEKVNLLNNELQNIVRTVEGKPELKIFMKTEAKCRWITKKVPMVYCLSMWLFVYLPSVIHSMACIWRGNYNTDTWFVPTKASIPINTSTVFGWYMALLLLVLSSIAYVLTLTLVFTYLASCYLYIVAIRDYFKSMFNDLDEKITLSQINSTEQIGRDFAEIVSLHVKATEIIKSVADINSGVIFWNLLTNVVLIASSTFYLDQSVRRMEISALESLLAMAANIFWSFLLCYMATASSDTVASIGDIVYNGNWPEYPPIYRKYVLLMILRSQQPTRFTGLKMVYCTLENFTKLAKASWNYYLILRNLSRR